MLSKEQLLENRAALQGQWEDLIKDSYAVTGAIQNCDYLIGLCEEDRKPESCCDYHGEEVLPPHPSYEEVLRYEEPVLVDPEEKSDDDPE